MNQGFERLSKLLGRKRLLDAKVVEPTAEDFPDPYNKSAAAVEALFRRVCLYMQVERTSVELEIFPDETEELREILPHWSGGTGKQAAGLYLHAHENKSAHDRDGRMVVAIRSTMLKDPTTLVATIAHELGHVILLGGGLMSSTMPDHEPMTDLLTVYLGVGIFTANSAARFKQFESDRKIGWQMQRLGYLPENIFGYALAKFANERNENKPRWARHLSPNVRADFNNSARWLIRNPEYVHIPEPFC